MKLIKFSMLLIAVMLQTSSIIAMACDEVDNPENILNSQWAQWLSQRNANECYAEKLFEAVSPLPFMYFMSIDRAALKIKFKSHDLDGRFEAGLAPLVEQEKVVFCDSDRDDSQLALLPLIWRERFNCASPIITKDKQHMINVEDCHILTVKDANTNIPIAKFAGKPDSFLSLICVANDSVTIMFHDQHGSIFIWNYETNSINNLFSMDDSWERAYVVPGSDRWYIITEKLVSSDQFDAPTYYHAAVTEVVPGNYFAQLFTSLSKEQISLLEMIFDAAHARNTVDLRYKHNEGQLLSIIYETLPHEIQRLIQPLVIVPDPFEQFFMDNDSKQGWLSGWCSIV